MHIKTGYSSLSNLSNALSFVFGTDWTLNTWIRLFVVMKWTLSELWVVFLYSCWFWGLFLTWNFEIIFKLVCWNNWVINFISLHVYNVHILLRYFLFVFYKTRCFKGNELFRRISSTPEISLTFSVFYNGERFILFKKYLITKYFVLVGAMKFKLDFIRYLRFYVFAELQCFDVFSSCNIKKIHTIAQFSSKEAVLEFTLKNLQIVKLYTNFKYFI